jgi:hypothetical protein
MPQVIDFPALTPVATIALVRVCKETQPKEPFRELRSRLRGAKLWDRDRPQVILRFLGASGPIIHPSVFMQAVAAAPEENAVAEALLDRVWQLNPLLAKTIIDLVTQRPYHKDEIAKHLASGAFKGVMPSRPALEIWMQNAITHGLLKTVGIAVQGGPRIDRYTGLAATLDVEEFLAEDKPEPEPVIPAHGETEDGTPTADAGGDSSIPNTAAAAPTGSPLPAPLRHLSADGVPTPRNRERVIPTSRFAQEFSEEILDETRSRIASWWTEINKQSLSYQPSDFGIDAEAWVEGADEIVYRIAVAAALVFRLDRDRSGVLAAFSALDKAGILGDLYQGNVPENLPAQIDARALMLASLAARRCAEVPELSSQLDGRANAGEAFASLDQALGRGLFRTELFWIMAMLQQLGVIRYDDLADYTVTPHRIVRDTLFRLGFLTTPYANDGPALSAASRAARKAVREGAADEILTMFALAAGCAYDCTHRKTCDFPCRERLE